MTNGLLVNNEVPLINFQASMPASGHSVSIYRGNFSPSIIKSGKTVINDFNGFPS